MLDGLTATTAELNLLAGLTATAAELNKADRTVADGVAEASLNLVLDANKDLLGKRYDVNQSLLDSIAGKPYLRFDQANAYVEIADDANIQDIFAQVASVEGWVYINSDGENDNGGIINKGNPNGWLLRTQDESGDTVILRFQRIFSGATGQWNVTLTKDRWHHFVVVYDDTAVDNDPTIYIDGVSQVISEAQAPVGTAVTDVGNNLYLGTNWGTASTMDGLIAGIRLWNRLLSALEVKGLASGAPLSFDGFGASQTDLVANGDDWTGATGSTPPNSWSDSGGASVTYIIRDNTGVANMDDKVLEIDVSGSGSKTLSQGVFQTGKRYRVTFAYRNLDGSGGATKVTFGSSANSATLQNTTISGDGIIFTQDVLADGPDLAFEVTTAGSLQIDAVQVVQIGCVLAFRPEGIGQLQWQDAGGNELHGQVNGAIPLNLPSNHLAAYVKKGITADTTLTGVVPAGYRIRSITVEETAGNAITGGLKIGTSAGGTQVVNAQAVGASALVDCALGTRLFSLTTAQTLYVEDVTAWNSASIDLYLEMERIK
ncbi:MAG: LamG domain-containing protein [Candidatus Marinimicrobia bacterium]|nr:LamG domain-containing protein [Candidatus Neomarinimicrobiota bacterium]